MANLEWIGLTVLTLLSLQSVNGEFQVHTVQDIADMQNEVLYETFDYFYFSQERQLAEIFQRVADLEARMTRVMQALGIYNEVEPPEEDTVRVTDAPLEHHIVPTVPAIRTRWPPVRPRRPKKNPQNRETDQPRRPSPDRLTPPPRQRRTRPPRPTTQSSTVPTTSATTTTMPATTSPPTSPPTTRPPIAATCAEIYELGLWSTGQSVYSIDPLRKNKFINVGCEKEDTDEGTVKMYTVVGHSKMGREKVKGFEAPGQYSLGPVYNATAKQLRALTRASRSCSQFIEYRCRGAVLMSRERNGPQTYGYWEDINGEIVESWGGAPSGSGLCECGVTRSCEGGGSCNCDSNSKTFVSDSGDITDKDRLPVTDVRLGDTGGKKETGYILLGALRCEG